MTTYYFISDLHIGGDEQLREVQFEAELIGFLERLEATDEDAELIINGDTFGLWEFTELEGMAKFDALLERYPELFEQFRATGKEIQITVIPGNHDYELAAYDDYVDRLAEWNVALEQNIAITRSVGDRDIWIEHGMQEDRNNRIPDYGNPYANPLGYFVNRHFTSKAGQLSGRGRYNWLKDIQSVTPMERIPEWLVSNYFYREMNPLLRYASLPFLLMFNVSIGYLLLVLLDLTGLWSTPLEAVHSAIVGLGVVGSILDAVIAVNLTVVTLLVLVSIPLYVYVRDVRTTLTRFGLFGEPAERDPYVERARSVFAANPDVAAFVYGHTHRVSLRRIDGRALVNTGTWLKRFTPAATWVGILPPVFHPSFRLSYFRITASEDGVVIQYDEVAKANPTELSALERLLSKRPDRTAEIPDETVIER
ncbi:metallophosphoesterase [Haloarcula laminariae]|uniref:metallophosphoesterase n=1 Tax=Haloarcula laminariae TaxID=2961577 RepID=UPI0021C605BD|nr:metallophosphoesterase [Halomicroarcula laminariae]